MWLLRSHQRPGSSWSESSPWGWWGTAALIIACLAPWASAVAVEPPQTQEDNTSSSPRYAELPAEPQDSQPTLQEIEHEARANTEIIQPHMSRSDLVALCKRLELDKAQTACADEAFDRYDEQVQEIHQEFLDRVAPLALQYFQALQEGGEELARAQAGGAMMATAKIGERYQAQIRQRLDAFLGQLQTCFSESQLEAYPGALRAWRRSVMLNPHASDSCYSLGYHVDIFEVIETACQEEPGLGALLDGGAEPPSEPALAEARRKCLELLDAFELELDRLIQRRFRRRWDSFFKSMEAWGDDDEDATHRTRRKDRRDWMKVYRANTDAAESLGLIIQDASGMSLANAWRDCYYAAYSPAMYRPKSTDLLYEWLIDEADLAAEPQAAIEAIYAQYIETRRSLRAHTRSILLRLTEELNLSSPVKVAVHDAGRPPAQLAKLYQRHRTLREQTNLQFQNMLSGDQQAAFDRVLERLHRRGFDHEPLEF